MTKTLYIKAKELVTMRFDIPSLIFAAVILLIALASSTGLIAPDTATAGFILLPTLGFAWSRREVCKARNGACPA
jgi:hypothetical protein